MSNPFNSKATLETPAGDKSIYRLAALRDHGDIDRLPYSIKILLEACLRNVDGFSVTEEHVRQLAAYDARNVGETEIPFKPGRVLLQDFTGVPALVDLAAMRSGVVRMTGDEASASKINPLVPCDLVIDHSVQVDSFASEESLRINTEREFARNSERYEFLKWGQQAFDNFRVVPPGTGIVHQVNLEYLAKCVWETDGVLYPDSVVGTDSHTTMINGLGVLGWGVGGIEAEAVMLGQPISMLIPEVVGFKLFGTLAKGCTATDLVLTVTQQLREHGVVGKFVEFHGPGLDDMPLANRATLANMAPEYGATMGFFPIDERTLEYLRLSGRDDALIETVGLYAKEQGLWRDESRDIRYSADLELDMSTVEPSLAGPKRPQDRIVLSQMQSQWTSDLAQTFGKAEADTIPVDYEGDKFELTDGAVVLAAITSCTNTSNPSVMLAAGLLARNARKRGLNRKPWVKTSLAPGSQVVTEYLDAANVTVDLEALGFYNVGYGCTTCIGNSGPLPDPIREAIHERDLVACSVLSGNRNFEGRISADVKANYLASPPLVVAYAIAGTVNIDLTTDPLGIGSDGEEVTLADIWPSQQEIADAVGEFVTREQFIDKYADVFKGSVQWRDVKSSEGALYSWNEASTYVQEPPFFIGLSPEVAPITAIRDARCLIKVGDSITTDHISPAGAIGADTPAGAFLADHGVERDMFNSYGSRRGNDRIMTRGTFANIRVRNELAPGTEGGYTTDFTRGTDGEVSFIYDAAQNYKAAGTALVVLAGKDYGMGSSRDWAAKGTFLLGVRAVLAESYERIHRSNLVGMGVLPLCYKDGDSAASLGLTGREHFDIDIDEDLEARQNVSVRATNSEGQVVEFKAICRIDTPAEVGYYRNGGILHTVLREMARS
ncbi:MAG: aconitate hydratase AcnA [Myxococcales bacterium]|nr:aconitate hydratase AcnA [Myxococcales bacterium]